MSILATAGGRTVELYDSSTLSSLGSMELQGLIRAMAVLKGTYIVAIACGPVVHIADLSFPDLTHLITAHEGMMRDMAGAP